MIQVKEEVRLALQETEIITIISIVLSVFATYMTLIRYWKESRVQHQAYMVDTLYNLVQIIDNDRAVESRGLLRDNSQLNEIKDLDPEKDGTNLPPLDEKTQEAGRFIATTYDRLGFILKHDPRLEREILQWNGDVIADMWLMTRQLIIKKLRVRNPNYAKEFERIGKKALMMHVP